MKRIVLAGLFFLSPVPSPGQEIPAPLPDAGAAARAYADYQADICRRLIDVCSVDPAPPPDDQIEALRCRRAGQYNASCTFRYADDRCRARFTRSRDSALGWTVALAPPTAARQPAVQCRRSTRD